MTRTVPLAEFAAAFRPGERVFLPGSASEPTALLAEWAHDPERSRGLELTTSAVAGINRFSMDGLHPTTRATGIFMQPSLTEAQRDGRFRHLPVSYSGFVRHLRDTAEFDTCVVQVAPPGPGGRCSMGPSAEFVPLALAKSRRVVGLLNPNLPPMPGAPAIALDDFDLLAEIDTPPIPYDVGSPTEEASTIAATIASFIEDGDAVQVGLGKVPDALFGLLHDRRGLRLSSGMLSDGTLPLLEAGALDPTFPHVTCVFVGREALYPRLRGLEGFSVASCEITHDVVRLAGIERFKAVNSALAVDLFGQCNLELAEGRAVTGVGGAADFAVASRLSRGGLSIVALPSSFGKNPRSRIVPRLGEGLGSIGRHAVDVIITEVGTADLRGRSVHERAEAIIQVAAPAFRSDLAEAWREISAKL